MSGLVRRSFLAARPLNARAMSSSVRVLKNAEAPVPANETTAKRDLVDEQVSRIGDPVPASLVSDAPGTYFFTDSSFASPALCAYLPAGQACDHVR